MRVTSRPLITSPSGRKLNATLSTPSNSREMCGKFFVGCSRAKTEKKLPSFAAAYGMREYPSSSAKQLPNAVHNTSVVKTLAGTVP